VVFARCGGKPLTALMAQVQRARLYDGTEVGVKTGRPDSGAAAAAGIWMIWTELGPILW
jgi:membrane-bound inhibitor of C-type lysozyme